MGPFTNDVSIFLELFDPPPPYVSVCQTLNSISLTPLPLLGVEVICESPLLSKGKKQSWSAILCEGTFSTSSNNVFSEKEKRLWLHTSEILAY